jgi:hypothetical protein
LNSCRCVFSHIFCYFQLLVYYSKRLSCDNFSCKIEAVDSGGLGGNYLNKYFRLTLLSQVTDGAKIQHTKFFMMSLARNRKTNWKNLEGVFKTTLKNYDIGQKDWDVIVNQLINFLSLPLCQTFE